MKYIKHKNCIDVVPILPCLSEDLWRRENPDTLEFTQCNRSSGTRSRIDRVYTDIKIANNTKINHKIISFLDRYIAIAIDKLHSKTKNWKKVMKFIELSFRKEWFLRNHQKFFLYLKTKKSNFSSPSDCWEYLICET